MRIYKVGDVMELMDEQNGRLTCKVIETLPSGKLRIEVTEGRFAGWKLLISPETDAEAKVH